MSASPAAAWYLRAAAAVGCHWPLKAFGTTTFISLFFVAYFYVLRHPASVPTVMPAIALDRWIGFQPLALPVYLSLWLYVCLPPTFMTDRAQLYRYGISMAMMCAAGLAIFYLWPTAAPAPDIDWVRYPDLQFLKTLDATGNAFPSLHVATAFLSAFWFHRLWRELAAPGWVTFLTSVWCAGIVYSTVAIRQHVAVDALGGLVLGGLAAWLALPARYHGTSPTLRDLP